MGVVVNRAGIGDDTVYTFCRENGLAVLAEIPYDLRIAEAYSRGRIVADVSESIRQTFLSLAEKTEQLARAGEERCHA
jgi:MinD superfamily P-loop ATPase